MKIIDFATTLSGYPLRGSVDELPSGEVHFVQLKNVSLDEDLNWHDVPKVVLPSKREPIWLGDHDILFAARGTKTLAYPLANTPPKAVCAPQFFVLSINNPDQLLPEFLAWQINQQPAQSYLQRTATGAAMHNIRREVLENLPIVIPSLEKQNGIVKLWRATQRERRLLNQLINNRHRQLQMLANDLLQGSAAV